MRRVLQRDEQERRPRDQGGKPWQDVANDLENELHAMREQRYADMTAIRTMSEDVVRKANDFLRLEARYNKLQIEYNDLKRRYEGEADVQAEVEPEEASPQA